MASLARSRADTARGTSDTCGVHRHYARIDRHGSRHAARYSAARALSGRGADLRMPGRRRRYAALWAGTRALAWHRRAGDAGTLSSRTPMRPRRPFHLEGAPRSQPRSPDVHRARGTGSLRSNTRDGRRTPRRSVVLATRRWRRNLQTLMGQWVSGRSRLQKSPLDTQGSYEGCGSKTRRR